MGVFIENGLISPYFAIRQLFEGLVFITLLKLAEIYSLAKVDLG